MSEWEMYFVEEEGGYVLQKKLKHRVRGRWKPSGRRSYFRINLRPADRYVGFRSETLGPPGHIIRIFGKSPGRGWEVQAWLISKNDAHIQDGMLAPRTESARMVLRGIVDGIHQTGVDLFEVKQDGTNAEQTSIGQWIGQDVPFGSEIA
jgi:hypothetical protein